MKKELKNSLKEEGIILQNNSALWYQKKMKAHLSQLILTQKRLVLEKHLNPFIYMFGILGFLMPALIKSFRATIIFNASFQEIKSIEVEKVMRSERIIIKLKDGMEHHVGVGNKKMTEEWKTAIEKNIN